ncbi:MAG: hypothetical protein COB41_00145 [Proteobacteria bacterium]|nr:MAG: hypothetical protein COB41_00145 [Pseudomonadota bacterium]
MKTLIYIVKGHGPFSTIESVEDSFPEAKKRIEEYGNMGYLTSIAPKSMTREEYAIEVESDMVDFFIDPIEKDISVV